MPMSYVFCIGEGLNKAIVLILHIIISKSNIFIGHQISLDATSNRSTAAVADEATAMRLFSK